MAPPTDGLVSVVIVTHQSAATIARCIGHVRASAGRVEIIVVDNASSDGTPDIVAGLRAPRADGLPVAAETDDPRLIANADNRGFARACNQGAAVARGDAIVFLNPDAFVGHRAIATLAGHLRADRGLGLMGCRVLDESGKPHGPQRRREPTWCRSLSTLTGLARWERRWPALAGVEVACPSSSAAATAAAAVETVDAVNGAIMMLPRPVFERIGGFDGAFMLHAEDLDLCRRVRDAGLRVAIANDVEVIHIGGVSSRRRPYWVEWQKTRSLWRYFRKHQPDAGQPVSTLVFIGLVARFLLKLPVLLVRGAMAAR